MNNSRLKYRLSVIANINRYKNDKKIAYYFAVMFLPYSA